MPSPMPPQSGTPQSSPSPQSAAPDAQGQGGAISQLLMNVDKAIDHLNLVVGQSKVTSPEQKQMIGQVDTLFGKFMTSIGVQPQDDGDDQGPQGPGAQGQTVPPEAGGNKGAIPSPM